jgi:hypothetical protein
MRRVFTVITVFIAMSLAATGCSEASRGGRTAATRRPSTPVADPAATPSQTAVAFTTQVAPVSRAMVHYSWRPGCPVSYTALRMITMPYWGMDGKAHTGGQLVVNASVVGEVSQVFHKLWTQHYPIRQMEPVEAYKASDYDSIDADNTSAFNCRNATGSSSWSQHAYGLAIDVNPCENPYVSADGSIAHPRCEKYGDRSRHDPGLIHAGDATVHDFTSIGWGWGGVWNGSRDYQHFSSTGR